jgi:serine/threonine protein kinase
VVVVTDPPGYTCLRRINSSRTPDQVFLARSLGDGSEVAVRIFDRTLAMSRDRERFEHEAAGLKALADIRYVLPLLDAGVGPGGRAYVVMPYCVAGSLRDHAATVGRLSPAEAQRVGLKPPTPSGRCTGAASCIAASHRPMCSLMARASRHSWTSGWSH